MPASLRSSALPAPEILFEPGEIVETTGALTLLKKYNLHPIRLLARHLFGDWGDVSAAEAHANVLALAEHARVVSSYLMRDGERLLVVTECDRSITKFLLPHELRPCVGPVARCGSTTSSAT
ncbi:type I restriction endonuclease subunit M [Aromatoleum evansii]|uniref:type I restriction endonuclease subunit M n=1 Tax=Aromatoleum evansii TaxID=59406 RepID=UPI00145DB624|nr:type I restriction endonuclease subunit M [Aromatoleum evansii]NMG31767.1 type I restriction endonuclease subunit M [Aromatoleum evansii]